VTGPMTYKSSGGEVYPVKPGETWMCGSAHTFHCSDLMATQTFDAQVNEALDLHGEHAIMYADPPWNPAMIAQYQTKAGLERAEYDWAALHRRVLSLVDYEGIPSYIEGSVIQSNALQHLLYGTHQDLWAITYYGDRSAVLHYDGAAPPPAGAAAALTGKDDEHTPGIVLNLYAPPGTSARPGLVIDPVAGRGGTARHAAYRGWSSLNNELSPWRMSAALHSLARLTGDTPTRIN
jgi:hypothetical protein